MPRQPHAGGDAGQRRGVYGNLRDLGPAQPVGQRDRHERAAPRQLLAGFFQLDRIERDQPGQAGDHRVHIARVLFDDGDAVLLPVDRQRDAVAIVDQPAGGREQADIDAVFIRQQAKLIGLVHLQEMHPRRQHPGDTQLRAPQHKGAA